MIATGTHIKLYSQPVDGYLYATGNWVYFPHTVKYNVDCGLKQNRDVIATHIINLIWI